MVVNLRNHALGKPANEFGSIFCFLLTDSLVSKSAVSNPMPDIKQPIQARSVVLF